MLIGVIYSVAQSCVRRIIASDNDAVLQDPSLVLPGEGIITFEDSPGLVIADQLKLALGKDPLPDNCAVVDADGVILAQVKADPSIDTHPGGDLVMTGGSIPFETTYNSKTKEFVLEIPEKTTPAGTVLKDGTTLTEDLVEPAQTVTMTVDEAGEQTKTVKVAEAEPVEVVPVVEAKQ